MESNLDISPFLVHYQGYDRDVSEFHTEKEKTQQQIRALFDGSMVKRFHTIPTVTENNIGQHSHGVAMLCYLMTAHECSINLLMAALTHDLAEQYVGDIPSPSKRTLGVSKAVGDIENRLLGTVDLLFDLKQWEHSVLKLADCGDGMMFCARERMLGNRSKMLKHAYKTYGGYVNTAMKQVPPGPMAERIANIFTAIARLWKEHGNVQG